MPDFTSISSLLSQLVAFSFPQEHRVYTYCPLIRDIWLTMKQHKKPAFNLELSFLFKQVRNLHILHPLSCQNKQPHFGYTAENNSFKKADFMEHILADVTITRRSQRLEILLSNSSPVSFIRRRHAKLSTRNF